MASGEERTPLARRLVVGGTTWLGIAAAAVATTLGQERADVQELSGAALAERIEQARPADRDALLPALDELSAAEEEAFVDWAAERRQADEGWRWLSPALARLGTSAAAGELAAAVREETETSPLALKALERMPAERALPELVAVLTVSSRRLRAAASDALARHVAAAPEAGLRRVEEGLGGVAFGSDAEARTRAGDAVQTALAAAYARTEDPAAVARYVEFFPARPALAVGLARGVAARLGRLARETPPPADDALEDPLTAERGAARRILEALGEREEAEVRAAVYRSLPAAVHELDDGWADLLLVDLEHPEQAVRDAAWGALRAVTGQRLPQTRAAWEAWWEEAFDEEGE